MLTEHPLEELIGDKRIEVFREHLKNKAMITLENNDFVDIQTINLFIQVYDGLTKEENKAKMRDFDLQRICTMVWRLTVWVIISMLSQQWV